ncbi:hypothetical protein ABPG75_011903 [Micractinium tetrahymenae]
MNLSALTRIGSAGAAALALRCHPAHPLLAASLGHAAAAGAAVALCSAAPLQRHCRGLFGKDWRSGRIGWLPWLALLPYHAGVVAAYWVYHLTSGEPRFSRIAEGLYLGCWPLPAGKLPSPAQNAALLDATNELHNKVPGTAYHCVPSFETLAAPADEIQAAVFWALQQRRMGRAVLVYCTHGHGRSAAMAAAVLLAAGEASDAGAALSSVKAARPGACPNWRQEEALHEWAARYGPASRD